MPETTVWSVASDGAPGSLTPDEARALVVLAAKVLAGLALASFIIWLFASTAVSVDEGERGIVEGAGGERVIDPGFYSYPHILPLVDNVSLYRVDERHYNPEPTRVETGEGAADVSVSVVWSVSTSNVTDVYGGNVDDVTDVRNEIVRPATKSSTSFCGVILDRGDAWLDDRSWFDSCLQRDLRERLNRKGIDVHDAYATEMSAP